MILHVIQQLMIMKIWLLFSMMRTQKTPWIELSMNRIGPNGTLRTNHRGPFIILREEKSMFWLQFWTFFQNYPFRKTVFGTRRSFSPNIPINALELNGPSIIEFSSENQLHEWAIYLSARQILFWRDGLINTKRMDQIYRKCRLETLFWIHHPYLLFSKVTDIYNPINQRSICDIETLKKRIHDQSVQFSNR